MTVPSRRQEFRAWVALIPVAIMALAAAAPAQAQRDASCGQPLPNPITRIAIPSTAVAVTPTIQNAATAVTAVTPTRDGCWLFYVAHQRKDIAGGAGIVVLKRTGNTFAEERVAPIAAMTSPFPPQAALTHDEKLLVYSHASQIAFYDVEKLTSGRGDPLLGTLSNSRIRVSAGVAISPDDQYAFVAQGALGYVAVLDLRKGRASGFDDSVLVGRVSTASRPSMPVLSADGRYLLATMQFPPDVVTPSLTCKGGKEAEGAIQMIDAELAQTDPEKATVGFAHPAGCRPTLLTLSPDGNRLSAVAAGEILGNNPPVDSNLLVFDARPVREGKLPTPIGRVPLAKGPVSVVDLGTRIVVGHGGNEVPLTVVDSSKVASGQGAIIGTIPTVFAVGLKISSDGRTLFGFTGDEVVIIDLDRAVEKTQPAK